MYKYSLTILFIMLAFVSMSGCDSDDPSISDGDGPAADGDGEDPDGDASFDGDIADGDQASDGDADSMEDGDVLEGDEDPEFLEEDQAETETEIEAEIKEDPPFLPIAACNMEAYELLPREDVGRVLTFEKNLFYDIDGAALDAILVDMADYPYLSPVPNGVRVYRFRYTTQDKGKPVEATSYIAFPANSGIEEGRKFPMALVLHGTTGYADSCAPTAYDLEGPIYAAIFASQGYIAIAPDYIGMNGFGEASTTTHGYTIGEQTAIGCWDALRAGEELLAGEFAGDVEAEEKYVLWGASQGGHAALFTELFGPYYAPEYEVSAVVADVAPTVMLPLAKIAVEEPKHPAFGFFMAVLATNRAWYGAPEDLKGIFTNEEPYYFADNAEGLVFFDGKCGEQNLDPPIPGGFDYRSIMIPEIQQKIRDEQWDEVEPWSCYMKENSLPTSSVPPLRYTPTLMVYSENDEIIIAEPMRTAYDQLCEMGYQLEYLECANADHVAGALWSLPEQFDWMEARLEGQAIDGSKVCKRHEAVCCSATPEGECD